MNTRELLVKQKLEQEGWKVLRNGAPDFVALKVDENGNIQDVKAVEVKCEGGRLSYEQSVYRLIFEWAKIPYEVCVQSDQSRPNQPAPVKTNPAQATPIQPTPNQAVPVRPSPFQTSPCCPNPGRSSPDQAMPI